MKTRWLLLILLLVPTITSCVPNGIQSPMEPKSLPSSEELVSPPKDPLKNSTQPVDVPPLATPEPDSPSEGNTPSMPNLSNPTIQSLVTSAIEDLAKRISTQEDEIQLKEAKDVVWSNSSLGCPQPGMVYADVLTPGYLILLNANNRDYEYHAGKNSDVFLCENPSPPVPGMPGDT